MNSGDEQLLRGRVRGHDRDGPNPGPLPHQTYAALVGGPLYGLLLDIAGWRPEEIDDGVALTTELGPWPGGCAPASRASWARGCDVPLPLLRRHALTRGLAQTPTVGRPRLVRRRRGHQPPIGLVCLELKRALDTGNVVDRVRVATYGDAVRR
ncbi:hypothetical protein OG384_37065 (plasmid) [Streptomyces sp. NBC_01324]|uniref:hypothetical protein n=1 Tax=Streptomyces sp. NBC_01324 TaxID=2903826 RepID=UPI002E119EB5|nr:hypothetical protein OG384_37065 [Streptomyces sp. NBC_01324]